MVIRIDRSDWLNPKDLLLFTEVQLPLGEASETSSEDEPARGGLEATADTVGFAQGFTGRR